jgi:hypothetical protein
MLAVAEEAGRDLIICDCQGRNEIRNFLFGTMVGHKARYV